jgi:hypothetical protein
MGAFIFVESICGLGDSWEGLDEMEEKMNGI